MISDEDLELIQSFKRQIDEKINIFNEIHAAVLQQEQELRILKQKTEDAKLEFDKQANEYKNTLSMLRTQIKFEREMLRSEEEDRNKYLLRSNRNSNTLVYLPAITFNLEKKQQTKRNRIVNLPGRYLISIENAA